MKINNLKKIGSLVASGDETCGRIFQAWPVMGDRRRTESAVRWPPQWNHIKSVQQVQVFSTLSLRNTYLCISTQKYVVAGNHCSIIITRMQVYFRKSCLIKRDFMGGKSHVTHQFTSKCGTL